MIAFGDSLVHTEEGTSISFNFATAGDNRILVVLVVDNTSVNGSDNLGTLKYNGVDMTFVDKVVGAAPCATTYAYIMVNPPVGSHAVALTSTPSIQWNIVALYYTGALQTGQPDNHTHNSATNATTIVTSLTTVVDNCWMISACAGYSNTALAGTGVTLRITDNSTNCMTGDSNGALTPAGNYSMTWNKRGVPNESFSTVQLSISPIPAVGGNVGAGFLMNFV